MKGGIKTKKFGGKGKVMPAKKGAKKKASYERMRKAVFGLGTHSSKKGY